MRMRRFNVGWLMALGILGCAMAVLAVPAQALGDGMPPWLVCADRTEAAELSTPHLAAGPANGATVPTGPPVTFSGDSFSGESDYALTFNVASSPALVSNPDIDSGPGSLQPGTSSYTFTSTKATATPRTVYWDASYTFTPEDCEGPSTFTTPVSTLVVASSEAELAAAKRQHEEEAAKKKSEEEAAAKKKHEEEAAAVVATGSVALDGSTITVQGSGEALLELACAGTGTCSGKLTVTAESTKADGSRRGEKSSSTMTTIGSARFSVSAGTTAMVKLTLNATGRALLEVDAGRLSASLTILESSPSPWQTHTENVRLVRQKAHGKAKK